MVLADDAAITSPVFARRNDQASLIERWCRLVGPERVTVVIAEKSRPEQLISAFEDLLGLPRGALADRPTGGYAANRTLSAPEAELVRRLNRVIRNREFGWPRYTQLIREGRDRPDARAAQSRAATSRGRCCPSGRSNRPKRVPGPTPRR